MRQQEQRYRRENLYRRVGRRGILFCCVFLGVSVAVLVAWVKPFSERQHVERLAHQVPPIRSSPVRALRGGPLWKSGTEYEYDFSLRASTLREAGVLLRVELAGVLVITAVGSNQLLLRFAGRLRDFGTGGSQAKPLDNSQRQELERDLKLPYYIRFEEDGQLKDVLVHSDAVPFVQTLWEGIGASIQYTRPAGGLSSWMARERDNSGEYDARYEAVGPNIVTRVKLAYRAPKNVVPGMTPDLTIGRSTSRFRMSEARSLASYDMTEEVTIDGVVATGRMVARSHMRLNLTAEQRSTEDLDDLRLEIGKLTAYVPARQASEALDHARTQGMKWEEALLALRRAATGEVDRIAKGRAYVALTAMLRLDSSRIELAKEGVREGSPVAQSLLDALRDADTEASRRALIELSEDGSLDSATRIRAVTALSITRTASAQGVEALKRLRENRVLRTQATFGIGSALNRLSTQGDEVATATLNYMLEQLEKSRDEHEVSAWLESLGNAGHPEALPVIAQYMESPSARVRRSAAQALRRVETPAAEGMLIELLDDKDDDVRASALDALSERELTSDLARAVAEVVTGDPDAANRVRAIRVAASWGRHFPFLSVALETAASYDSTAAVRDAARRGLASLRGTQASR